ncbi:MAG: nucleotidyl transferase AbiEii/AbiGii toxin family protein [Nanobdellota archaeon]
MKFLTELKSNDACKIIIDISKRESVILEPAIKRIGLHIKEIPMFDVVVMAEQEIFTEKIRVIMTRNKARDMYDMYYLVGKGITPDLDLINQKLAFYSTEFSNDQFKDALDKKKGIWESELRHLVRSFPDFSKARELIYEKVFPSV